MMGFKCVSGGDYVRITHVEIDDTGSNDHFAPYTGPVFDELDETLQQAFTDYLDERGECRRRGCKQHRSGTLAWAVLGVLSRHARADGTLRHAFTAYLDARLQAPSR